MIRKENTEMAFNTFIKNKQRRLLSKTWREKLVSREIEKNNFRTTGNIKKAKVFANSVALYHEQVKIPVNQFTEQTIIFSRQNY